MVHQNIENTKEKTFTTVLPSQVRGGVAPMLSCHWLRQSQGLCSLRDFSEILQDFTGFCLLTSDFVDEYLSKSHILVGK